MRRFVSIPVVFGLLLASLATGAQAGHWLPEQDGGSVLPAAGVDSNGLPAGGWAEADHVGHEVVPDRWSASGGRSCSRTADRVWSRTSVTGAGGDLDHRAPCGFGARLLGLHAPPANAPPRA